MPGTGPAGGMLPGSPRNWLLAAEIRVVVDSLAVFIPRVMQGNLYTPFLSGGLSPLGSQLWLYHRSGHFPQPCLWWGWAGVCGVALGLVGVVGFTGKSRQARLGLLF